MSIDDILKLKVMKFIEYVEPMDYQETRHMKILLEIERERSKMLHRKYIMELDYDSANSVLVNMVIIKDRLEIIDHFLARKGIDLSIFKGEAKHD